MSNFVITVQSRLSNSPTDQWPVVIEWEQEGEISIRSYETLKLDDKYIKRLNQTKSDPLAYGSHLGKALFRGHSEIAFARALYASSANDSQDFRVLLVVEALSLRVLNWECLCAPLDGKWTPLAIHKRTLFSLYLPSMSDRRFQPFGVADLRMLLLVASPPENNPINLACFSAQKTVDSIRTALPAGLEVTVLANNVEGAVGPPTLTSLISTLEQSDEQFTLLHIVAHGMMHRIHRETVVFFVDEDGRIQHERSSKIIKMLNTLNGANDLPHFCFLCTCESANPLSESVFGGLAQGLVREVGTPAVIAMTRKISIETGQKLNALIYKYLQQHGHPDKALTQASQILQASDNPETLIPALYSRLKQLPLFRLEGQQQPLNWQMISDGLENIEDLLYTRAPVLLSRETIEQPDFNSLKASLLTANNRQLPLQDRDVQFRLRALDDLCIEIMGIDFHQLARKNAIPSYNTFCPFPGLGAFINHADRGDFRPFFFGRSRLVKTLLQQIDPEHQHLTLLGPSGCGKSSLAEQLGWQMTQDKTLPYSHAITLTPGQYLAESMDLSLLNRKKGRTIIIVNQLEELFVLFKTPMEKNGFIALLKEQILSVAGVVIFCLRADYWGECTLLPDLKLLLEKNQKLLGPMSATELRHAMERQAQAVGLNFEAGLCHRIISELENEPGAMPLLQHLLQQLWYRRHGYSLTNDEYEKLGGIQGAIARSADTSYLELSPSQKKKLRLLFLSLTRLGEEANPDGQFRDSRRRVLLSDLTQTGDHAVNEATRELLEHCTKAGLLVVSNNEIQVAHEALIQHWPRLRRWLDEDRFSLRLIRSVERDARLWLERGRKQEELPNWNTRLDEVLKLLDGGQFQLNLQGSDFLQACKKRQLVKDRIQKRKETARLVAASRLMIGVDDRQALNLAIQAAAAQPTEDRDQKLDVNIALLMAMQVQIIETFCLQSSLTLSCAEWSPDGNTLACTDPMQLYHTDSNTRTLADGLSPDGLHIAWSHDGNQVVSSGWNAPDYSGAVIRNKRGTKCASIPVDNGIWVITQSVWSHDDTRLLSVAPNAIKIHDVTALHSQPLVLKPEEPQRRYLSAAWSYKDRYVAVATSDGRIDLFDLDGPVVRHINLKHSINNEENEVTVIRWSPVENTFLSGCSNGLICLWDLRDLSKEPLRLKEHNSAISAANWTRDGKRIATACHQGSINSWDSASGKLQQAFNIHRGAVADVSWLDSRWGRENLFVSCGRDGLVNIVDAKNGNIHARLAGHEGPISSVREHPSKQCLLTASSDGTARIWGQTVASIPRLSLSAFTAGYWSPDGKSILLLTEYSAYIWFPDSDRHVSLKSEIHGKLTYGTWHPDGGYCLTADDKGYFYLWGVSEGKALIDPVTAHSSKINHATWWSTNNGADTSKIALVGTDGKITLYSGAGELLQTLHCPWNKGMNYVAWNNTGDRLLTTAWHAQCARIWDVDSGKILTQIDHRQGVWNADWSPDYKRIVTAGNDGVAQLTMRPGSPASVIALPHRKSVINAVWNCDGVLIATASNWRTIKIWSSTNGHEIAELKGHSAEASILQWHPENPDWLLSAGKDGKICIWRIDSHNSTGSLLGALELHDGSIASASWCKTGKRILSVGSDGKVIVSFLLLDDLLDLAATRVNSHVEISGND